MLFIHIAADNCFGDDDDENDATDEVLLIGGHQLRYPLPRFFFPPQTGVKKPTFPSQPALHDTALVAMMMMAMIIAMVMAKMMAGRMMKSDLYSPVTTPSPLCTSFFAKSAPE